MESNKKSGLEFLAEKINQDIEREIEEIEKRDVEIPEEYYKQMRPFIHKLNQELEQKKKKQTRQRWMRMAAVFAVVFISLNAAALGTSEAYRDKVFSLFHDEEQGGVTFVFDAEGEMVEDWENYWAPTWIPEGFQLYATDKNESGHFILFQDDKNQIIRLSEYTSDSQISFDTETLGMEEVSIGQNNGYYFKDTEHPRGYVFWYAVKYPIILEFVGADLNKEVVLKVAENMYYVR